VNFTAGRIADFTCEGGKSQAFLWDSRAPGLALRVTAAGSRAYIFQSRLRQGGGTVRITIGEPIDKNGRGTWTIPAAQDEARRLQSLIDQGKDPRQERAAQAESDKAARAAAQLQRMRLEVTGLTAWEVYCDDRKGVWSARNHADHIAFAAAGGVKRKRAAGTTMAGPLRALLSAPLASIDAEALNNWVSREVKERPTRARLGFRLFRAFINWCAEHEEYKAIANLDACRGKKTRERLGRGEAKNDALQREQLRAWFDAVRKDPNPVAASYLQALLLTGARREELAGLRWEDVDFDWGGRLNIPDKVQGRRTIPLTPYVAHLLRWLPRRPGNPFVFTSATSASGRLSDARSTHVRALEAAGLPHVTLHGLRRSFGTLAEWVDVPIGVVAQIQGHKPSAIAEKHYRVRPIDMLLNWHRKIEDWMLQTAGVDFALTTATSSRQPQVVAA